jgi:uncharacterized metal-binding protein YceD (DUF177 family)
LGKFDTYKVDLKSLSYGVHEFEYLLENKFFADIDGNEVQKGKVKINLVINHSKQMSEMNFRLDGFVYVPCDRCLDDMEVPIATQNRLIVKFGKEYAEESDEIVIIPVEEGVINLAWFLYEFVVLYIPMKHVHSPGKCNKGMSSKLRKHTPKSSFDEDGYETTDDEGSSGDTDPRWDALKGLMEDDIDNDNN